MQFASLVLNEVIFHQIPGRGSGAASLVLSEASSPLDEEQRTFIQGQIRNALAQYARPIIEMSEGNAPSAFSTFLDTTSNFVSLSQDLAHKLQRVQPAISPGGVFLVARAGMNAVDAVVVAKLEHEVGVRAEQTTLADGKKTFDIRLLQDLLFTTAGQVFKVALLSHSSNNGPMRGFVVDAQSSSFGVAQYFLNDFLECDLLERADTMTERFQTGAERWINQQADPEKRARYEVGLLADLQSNERTLSADDFAIRHLEPNDRDSFVSDMVGSGVPQREFEKDTALIRSRLRRVRIDTASGTYVNAPTEAFENGTIEIRNEGGSGGSTIIVRDQILLLSGRGRVQGKVT